MYECHSQESKHTTSSYLEEFVEQEGEPVGKHFLCHRLCPRITAGRERAWKRRVSHGVQAKGSWGILLPSARGDEHTTGVLVVAPFGPTRVAKQAVLVPWEKQSKAKIRLKPKQPASLPRHQRTLHLFLVVQGTLLIPFPPYRGAWTSCFWFKGEVLQF